MSEASNSSTAQAPLKWKTWKLPWEGDVGALHSLVRNSQIGAVFNLVYTELVWKSVSRDTSKKAPFLSENLIFSVNQGVSAETSQPGEILLLLILIPMIKSRQSLRLQSGWKQPRSIFVCGCFDDVSYEMHEGVLNENYSCWLQKSQFLSAHLTVDVLA